MFYRCSLGILYSLYGVCISTTHHLLQQRLVYKPFQRITHRDVKPFIRFPQHPYRILLGQRSNLRILSRRSQPKFAAVPQNHRFPRIISATRHRNRLGFDERQRIRRFRQELLHRVPLHTDKTYAYRHRTLFGKMCGRETIDGKTVFSFAQGNPKTLEGFDFNLESPWEKRCHFFPEFGVDKAGVFSIHIPALRMGEQIKKQTEALKAILDFWLVSAVPPRPNHTQINLLWHESFEVFSNQAHPPVVREIPDCPADEWLLVLASCRYEFNQSVRLSQNSNKFPQPASTYLWGRGKLVMPF